MRKVFAHHLQRHVVIGGRKAPKSRPKLQLARYIDLAKLGNVPSAVDYTAAARPAIAQLLGNDAVGDCVDAGYLHQKGIWTGNASAKYEGDGDARKLVSSEPYVASADEAIKLYSATAGYVPGNPATDQGTDEQAFLDYLKATGDAEGVKINGYVGIDACNWALVKAASWLFESLMLGMALADAWISPFPGVDGFVWDTAGAPDPNDGHCVVSGGHSDLGLTIVTWGLVGTLTHGAVSQYLGGDAGGQLYAVLSPEIIAKGQEKAPAGVSWDELLADLQAVGTAPTPEGKAA